MKDFLLSLQFIFRPTYWVMNYEYDDIWDAKLRKLMDKHKFTPLRRGNFKHTLGDEIIWTTNHPYSSFTPCDHTENPIDIRPSRLTILRARKKLIKETEQ